MAATPHTDSETSFDAGNLEAEERFVVDVDGFEGPLDLLLELARRQKVDLDKISVLALAEQYLTFIETARGLRLELAADYLVMAAWLAYLKSRLLLPRTKTDDEPDVGAMAAALAERLRRLEVIRAAARALEARPQMGRDTAARGMPDATITDGGAPVWTASIYDLLSAYARQRQKHALSRITLRKRSVWSLGEAREILAGMIGDMHEWGTLDDFLIRFYTSAEVRRTVRASMFSAALEMAKEGKLSLRQDRVFAPLWVKARPAIADRGGT